MPCPSGFAGSVWATVRISRMGWPAGERARVHQTHGVDKRLRGPAPTSSTCSPLKYACEGARQAAAPSRQSQATHSAPQQEATSSSDQHSTSGHQSAGPRPISSAWMPAHVEGGHGAHAAGRGDLLQLIHVDLRPPAMSQTAAQASRGAGGMSGAVGGDGCQLAQFAHSEAGPESSEVCCRSRARPADRCAPALLRLWPAASCVQAESALASRRSLS